MGLMEDLGLKVPLIVAPMAGGPSTPALAIASCEAGALGSLGLAYSSPSMIADIAAQMRLATQKRYGMNLFVPAAHVDAGDISVALDATREFRRQMNLAEPVLTPPYGEDFDQQFAEVLRARPGVVSFVFGRLNSKYIREAHAAGQIVMGAATTLDEALALEDDGVDAVVLQGLEAGGHRAIHEAGAQDPEIALFDLLRAAKGRLRKPSVAAGGLMTRAQVTTALGLGAELVQMGSAFLLTREAGTSAPYRKALAESSRATKTTRAFSGRLARGIENRFMRELDSKPEVILPYPLQNKFTRDIRAAFAKAGNSEALSLWCGSGSGPLFEGACADLIRGLFPSGS